MSSETTAIEVSGVRKTYRIGLGRARVREMIPPPLDRLVARIAPRWWSKDTFDALAGVTFDVPAGSSAGLIGHNGAGKTTLLKIVSGVTEPTEGSALARGRLAALIDVMVGFNPDLTGRENVFLLGALHGLGRRAMRGRLDGIVAFAEIDDMLDTPVKRYSAGMGARLGFATMASLGVDVLLIDEVLAVGDAAFQQKCIRWLESFRRDGGTLLFVSHNLALVRSMTERVVWLDRGRVVGDGPTEEILRTYAKAMERRESPIPSAGDGRARTIRAIKAHRWGAGGAYLHEVHMGDAPRNGEPLEISITYESAQRQRAVFCVGFLDESGAKLGSALSPAVPVDTGIGEMRCSIEPFPLRDGIYFPVVAILTPDGTVRDKWRLDRALVIDREHPVDFANGFGPVQIPSAWGAR